MNSYCCSVLKEEKILSEVSSQLNILKTKNQDSSDWMTHLLSIEKITFCRRQIIVLQITPGV